LTGETIAAQPRYRDGIGTSRYRPGYGSLVERGAVRPRSGGDGCCRRDSGSVARHRILTICSSAAFFVTGAWKGPRAMPDLLAILPAGTVPR